MYVREYYLAHTSNYFNAEYITEIMCGEYAQLSVATSFFPTITVIFCVCFLRKLVLLNEIRNI